MSDTPDDDEIVLPVVLSPNDYWKVRELAEERRKRRLAEARIAGQKQKPGTRSKADIERLRQEYNEDFKWAVREWRSRGRG